MKGQTLLPLPPLSTVPEPKPEPSLKDQDKIHILVRAHTFALCPAAPYLSVKAAADNIKALSQAHILRMRILMHINTHAHKHAPPCVHACPCTCICM